MFRVKKQIDRRSWMKVVTIIMPWWYTTRRRRRKGEEVYIVAHGCLTEGGDYAGQGRVQWPF